MRKIIVPVLLLLILTLWINPAAAIVYGTLDGNDHPNVALLSALNLNLERIAVCSGVLIGERVVLTAGHCTALLEQVQVSTVKVSFDSTNALVNGLQDVEMIITHPGFVDGKQGHDVGLVILKDAPGLQVAALPGEGDLDGLDLRGTTYNVVGYGAYLDQGDKPKDVKSADGKRRVAVSGYQKLLNTLLRLSQVQARDEGGSCFRDSGGPVFLKAGGTEKLVAIVSSGDGACVAMSNNYRLDIADSLDFIQENLPQ